MPLLPRLASLWRNLFHKSRKEDDRTGSSDHVGGGGNRRLLARASSRTG